MIHLFVPFYVDAREPRRKEIEDSARRNLSLAEFGSVTLLCEQKDAAPATALVARSPKARVVSLPRRARYVDLLQFAQKNVVSIDVAVIANADICFDKTVALVEHVQERQVLCLTRAEQRPFGEGLYWPELETGLSHDVWVFRPPLTVPGDYEFGKSGCELRFSGECEKSGYKILNPCRQIHVMHNHASGLRTYTTFGSPQVPGPYAHAYVTDEWPPKVPECVKVEPPPPTPDENARKLFVRETVQAQLSGLWGNCPIDGMMNGADKRVQTMFDIAEKVAHEAERRKLL